MDPHEGFTFFFGSVNSGLVEFSFFPQMTSSLDLLKLGKSYQWGTANQLLKVIEAYCSKD